MQLNPAFLLQRSSLYFLCTVASRLVGFVMIPLYSRHLTPAEYGTIEILELATQILSLCFGLQSIGTALSRAFHDEPGVEGRNQAVSTTLWMTAGMNLTLIASVFPFAGGVGSLALRSGGYAWLIRASIAGLLLSTLIEVVLTYARLKDRLALFATYSLVSLIVTATLNVYLIAFQGLGVLGFVYSKLLASGAGCLYLMAVTVREVGWGWNTAVARRMVKFGAPLIAANLAFFVIHFSDRFFLSASRGLDEVGTYSLAYRFAFLITVVVAEPFGRVWNVTMYSFAKNSGWERQFARVARYLAVALCAVCLVLSLFGEIIIHLMSTRVYYAAASVLPILAFAYVLREIGDFYRNVLFVEHRSGVVGAVAVISAVANLSLNYILIARYGMFGAAWATLATWTVYMTLCWMNAHRRRVIPFEFRSFVTVTGLAAAIYILVTNAPQPPPLWNIAWRMAWIGAFIFTLGAAGYFPKEELRAMRAKVFGRYQELGKWVRVRT